MHKGARVKLSQQATELGLNLNAKRRNRRRCIEGTIISPTPVKQIVAVLWDDRIKAEIARHPRPDLSRRFQVRGANGDRY
jgi:hypothetical protein